MILFYSIKKQKNILYYHISQIIKYQYIWSIISICLNTYEIYLQKLFIYLTKINNYFYKNIKTSLVDFLSLYITIVLD